MTKFLVEGITPGMEVETVQLIRYRVTTNNLARQSVLSWHLSDGLMKSINKLSILPVLDELRQSSIVQDLYDQMCGVCDLKTHCLEVAIPPIPTIGGDKYNKYKSFLNYYF